MARPYAKLAVGSGADEKLGMLAERNGLGGMMFLLSIAEAYPYGILPGSPRAYRAAVLPAALVSEADVQDAIDAQVEVGLVHRYEADGHPLLYLVNYHRYQDVTWTKVRPSAYLLPECWRVPDNLQAMIDDGSLMRARKQFGRYGVMGLSERETEATGQVPLCPPGAPHLLQQKRGRARQRGGTSTATATGTGTGTATSSRKGRERSSEVVKESYVRGPRPEWGPGEAELRREFEGLHALLAELHPGWTDHRLHVWTVHLGRATQDPHTPLDEAAMMELLRAHPPSEADRSDTWMRRAIVHRRIDAEMAQQESEAELSAVERHRQRRGMALALARQLRADWSEDEARGIVAEQFGATTAEWAFEQLTKQEAADALPFLRGGQDDGGED